MHSEACMIRYTSNYIPCISHAASEECWVQTQEGHLCRRRWRPLHKRLSAEGWPWAGHLYFFQEKLVQAALAEGCLPLRLRGLRVPSLGITRSRYIYTRRKSTWDGVVRLNGTRPEQRGSAARNRCVWCRAIAWCMSMTNMVWGRVVYSTTR